MSQINDCIHRALGSGHINDLLVEYFQTYGATSFQVNDAAYEFLILKGATPGSLDDMWFEFLKGQGYSGSLNDMLLEFWCADDCVGWAYCMLIGQNADFYGYASALGMGGIDPDFYLGIFIHRISVNAGNNLVAMHFGPSGFDQIPDVDTLFVRFEGLGEQYSITWEVTNSRYALLDEGLRNHIVNNLGEHMGVSISTSTNAVLHFGDAVEFNGEVVTHG